MSQHWLLALAVPLFLVFISLEILVARKKKLSYFRIPETIANISVGIAERATDLLTTGLFFSFFQYLHDHHAIWTIKPGILHWFLLFLLTDFIWYWYHRLAHEINLFWAVHIVHHQSEDYNYTVSARITVFQAVVRCGFWSVLPVIGYPPEMIFSLLLIHGLYPFFIHTRLVNKLGILEYLLVTPSHHRVHHASNEQYLNKNYGDVFIIWDKLFGTFQEEKEAPRFGLTHPLNSYSFLWQHFHYFIELSLAMKRQRRWMSKLKVLFDRPASLDPKIRMDAEKIFNIHQSSAKPKAPLNKYVIWQIIFSLGLLFGMIAAEPYLDWTEKFLILGFLLLTLINCGAILEKKTWVYYLEFTRIFILLAGTLYLYPSQFLLLAIVCAIVPFLYYKRQLHYVYLKLVY